MRIVLLGTGNLATRMGLALHEAGVQISQVYGRDGEKAARLAALVSGSFVSDTDEIEADADLYLLALSESAFPDILARLPVRDRLVVHTCGSLPMDLLSSCTNRYGVFYPLQTLSADRRIDFRQVPLCIEANDETNLQILNDLGCKISDRVVVVDSEQRRELHLAAVFVCNFVNHCYAIGSKLLQERGLDAELLKPLLRETALKAMEFPPVEVQTGPAIRGNEAILALHERMLEQHSEWQSIYRSVSQSIRTMYHPD